MESDVDHGDSNKGGLEWIVKVDQAEYLLNGRSTKRAYSGDDGGSLE